MPPTNRWTAADVTSTRRPELGVGESICYVQSDVGLYGGRQKLPDCQDGTAYLTTWRIIYVDRQAPATRSMALALSDVAKVEYTPGFLKSSPKITITYFDEAVRPAAGPSLSVGGLSPIKTPTTPRPDAGDWLCPICTFTNPLPTGYEPTKPLPPCDSCGMKPPKTVKVNMHHEMRVPTPPPRGTNGRQSGDLGQALATKLALNGGSTSGRNSDAGATFPCPRCTFGNHPAVQSCEICGAPLLSRNLPPVLVARATSGVSDERRNSASTDALDDASQCKISFRQHGSQTFLEKLRAAIAERAWDRPPAAAVPPARTTNDSTAALSANGSHGQLDGVSAADAVPERRGAGIGALQHRQQTIRDKGAVVMSDGFQDLRTLMAHAKDLVALAESFSTRLSAAPQSSLTAEARQFIADSSMALGLKSAVVTKDVAGREDVYRRELARQIAEFLLDAPNAALDRAGGVLTLADLYALYNRARRGSTVVAPEDLRGACEQFEPLGLGVVVRRFRSGVAVVQARSRTDAHTRRLVLDWLRDTASPQWRGHGVTPTDAAARFRWSVAVAREELEMCEQSGDLCRDAGTAGDRFYENRIAKFDYASWRQERQRALEAAAKAARPEMTMTAPT